MNLEKFGLNAGQETTNYKETNGTQFQRGVLRLKDVKGVGVIVRKTASKGYQFFPTILGAKNNILKDLAIYIAPEATKEDVDKKMRDVHMFIGKVFTLLYGSDMASNTIKAESTISEKIYKDAEQVTLVEYKPNTVSIIKAQELMTEEEKNMFPNAFNKVGNKDALSTKRAEILEKTDKVKNITLLLKTGDYTLAKHYQTNEILKSKVGNYIFEQQWVRCVDALLEDEISGKKLRAEIQGVACDVKIDIEAFSKKEEDNYKKKTQEILQAEGLASTTSEEAKDSTNVQPEADMADGDIPF